VSPGGQGPVKFATVRVYHSYGAPDKSAPASIKSARAAGVEKVDGYLYPCVKCGDPAGQVADALNALEDAGVQIGRLWYDIEGSWPVHHSENQAFMKGLVDAGVSRGIPAGVYTNWNSWEDIVGSSYDYPSSKGLPVWYPHYDGNPSFSDFQQFGGWDKPMWKQYLGDQTSCNTNLDYNFLPEDSIYLEHQPRLTSPNATGEGEKGLIAGNWTTEAENTSMVHVANASLSGCSWAAYSQCDSRWKNEPLGTSTTNTICKAGCAMSSLAMYLTTRGHSMNPSQLNAWLNQHGGYAQSDLLVWSAVDSAFSVSYQGQETSVDVDTLQKGLAACHGIIANVRGGSHWVLLTGYAGNDNFYVNDPGFAQSTYPHSEMLRFSVYH